MFMKTWLMTVAICLLGLSNSAQETARVTSVEIIEAGIYTGKVTRTVEVPGVISGKWKGLESFTLLQATTNVPARVGTTFGFRYRINATPTNTPVRLTMVGEHPPIIDPKTGKPQTKDTYQFTALLRDSFASFVFDEEWEVAPGKWRFEIWHQDEKFCEQEFLVLPKDESQSPKK